MGDHARVMQMLHTETALVAHGKTLNTVIPSEVRNPSFAYIQEGFLASLGMTA
jgi:hypothetical protein